MKNSELLDILRILSPGTPLRKALNYIVRGRLGSILFFVSSAKEFEHLIQDGFFFNTEFTPEKLYELSKMDGAIILDEGATRIFAANTQLIPDTSIQTTETGMRHRTAERLSRQTGNLVVTVSSRSNVITIYKNRIKYPLHNTNFLMSKINQSLSVLEQYKNNLNRRITHFEVQELTDTLKLSDIVRIIGSLLETLQICEDILPDIIEIGEDGKLADMRLQETVRDIEEQLKFLDMDYQMESGRVDGTESPTRRWDDMEDSGPITIARLLGYDISTILQSEEIEMTPRGYRMLVRKAKIPISIAEKAVREFGNIRGLQAAAIENLKGIEGIGIKRANAIIESIDAVRNRICTD